MINAKINTTAKKAIAPFGKNFSSILSFSITLCIFGYKFICYLWIQNYDNSNEPQYFRVVTKVTLFDLFSSP